MKKFMTGILLLLCLACQTEPRGVTSFSVNCDKLALNQRILFWAGAKFRLEHYVGEGNFELIEITPEKKKVVLKGHMSEADARRFFNLSKDDLVFAEMVAAQKSRNVLLALDSLFSRDSTLLPKPTLSQETAVANKAISSTNQLLAEDKWTEEDSILRAWKIYEQPIESLIYFFEERDNALDWPVIGMVDIQDTATVNRLLRVAATKELLGDIRYVYAQKAEKGKDYLLLYSVAYDLEAKDYRGLSGSYVDEVQIYDAKGGRYNAQMNFNAEGALLWEEMTRAQTGKYVGMLMDDKLWSMPKVSGAITGGYTAIKLGDTPLDQARQFAVIINIGPMKYQSEIAKYQYDSTAVWSR